MVHDLVQQSVTHATQLIPLAFGRFVSDRKKTSTNLKKETYWSYVDRSFKISAKSVLRLSFHTFYHSFHLGIGSCSKMVHNFMIDARYSALGKSQNGLILLWIQVVWVAWSQPELILKNRNSLLKTSILAFSHLSKTWSELQLDRQSIQTNQANWSNRARLGEISNLRLKYYVRQKSWIIFVSFRTSVFEPSSIFCAKTADSLSDKVIKFKSTFTVHLPKTCFA